MGSLALYGRNRIAFPPTTRLLHRQRVLREAQALAYRLDDRGLFESGSVCIDRLDAGTIEEEKRLTPCELAMKPQADRTRECKPIYRKLIIVAVLLHLLAVLAEPLAFFSRSEFQTGPEFFALRRTLAPYVEWMYLDHGYFFFAPNPGPNHLVAAQEKSTETNTTNTPRRLRPDAVIFPDRQSHWPRLLYHRYFMLSEFYNNSFAPTELTEQDKVDRMFVERWELDRRFYESLQRSISKSHLIRRGKEGLATDRMELLRIERPLPSPEQILGLGGRLGDSRDLIVLPEGPENLVSPTQLGVP